MTGVVRTVPIATWSSAAFARMLPEPASVDSPVVPVALLGLKLQRKELL